MPDQYKYEIILKEIIQKEPRYEYDEVFSIKEVDWQIAKDFFDSIEEHVELYNKDKTYIVEFNSVHKTHPEQKYLEETKSYDPYLGWE